MPKKIKITVVENGFDKEIEIEVPDEAGSWQKPEEMRQVNKRHTRLDGVAKVTGRAKYAADAHPKGMVWGRILRAPHGKARLTALDVEAARKVPGFKGITGDVEAGKEYSFAGQPVCAIAGATEEAADDVLHALNPQWDVRPAVASLDGALRDLQNGVLDARALGEPRTEGKGDVNAALGTAAARVEGRYGVPTQHHVCLEPHGHTIAPNQTDAGGENRLIVWATTQGVQGVHSEFTEVSKLPAGNVEVICEYMGGGFGSKFGIGAEGRFAWELAQAANAPVRLLLDRKDEFRSAGNRPGYTAQIQAAANAEGKLTAYDATVHGANSGRVPVPYSVYNFETSRTNQREIRLNANGPIAFRAPGHPEASFLTELVIDELAYKLNLDPLEFRRNAVQGNEKRLRQLAAGAKAIEWEKYFQKKPGAAAGPRKRGVGLAQHQWGGGGSPSTPVTVKIHPDGNVEALTGSQDLGTGTRTVVAQVVAEELGLQTRDILVKIGHSSYGRAGGSGGSTTCASIAPSAKMGGLQARMALFNAVAPALNAKPEELELRDGKVMVKDQPARALTWKAACAKLGMNPVSAVGQWIPGLSDSGVAGCGFALVEVDVETGKVRVVKYVAVQDSGLVINKMTWESQINGAVIIGLGYATLEERVLDPNIGGFLNANLLDYKVPMAREVPEIVVIEDPEPQRGVIGVGEPPMISPGAAIANAVFNASGVRVRQLPITPDKFLMAARQKA